jgi:Asp-tRNA(Asn)/Glu-tRNA(Gln) amidotransferase A subunit family amidase
LEDVPLLLHALGLSLENPSLSRPPRVGVWRTELWGVATPAVQRYVEEAAKALASAGALVHDVELGTECTGLAEAQATVMAVEAAASLGELRATAGAALSSRLRSFLDEGAVTPPARYRAALALAETGRRRAAETFNELDILLTPSATGEAPLGLETTGNPAFNRIPTLLGLPCLNVPGAVGPEGLPLGLQLVGPAGGDGLLLTVAAWVVRQFSSSDVFQRPGRPV